ncbi:MoaF N-terminal domain-containing protein [Kocuria atrinae]|uniref:MoaF N-terminal domain-containing protein n=1 Tax=Kocuria atrinae TaxID=592377 RepID=UPI00030EDBA6|nr:MoaF N-terminal domain-containing protein [Kocuria atrinae]
MTADNAFQDYVPVREWPSVSTMLDGFGDQTLPASPALTGTSVSLQGEDGRTFTMTFGDSSSLTWTITAEDNEESVEASYKAIEAVRASSSSTSCTVRVDRCAMSPRSST